MLIGYARVSTSDQNTAAQLDALNKAGCERIFEEKVSAVSKSRPELDRALDMLRDGDILMVWKLDRLCRSMRDLVHLLATIEERGAALKCLTQPVDTSTPAGRMMLSMLGAVAEFERDINKARTREGLAAAKRRGVQLGRRRALNQEQRDTILRMHRQEGQSQAALARLFDVSPSTISRLLKDMAA